MKTRRPALAMALVMGTAGLAQAFNPQPEPPAFGMIGLGRYQTAILNAVLTQPPDPAHPGCRLQLSFVNAAGEVFHDRAGNEVRRAVVLRGNAAVSLSLRAGEILADDESRKAIRGVVSDPPEPDVASDCRGLVATLEIVAPNGWTTVLSSLAVPPSGGGDPPPPDPR